MRYLSLSLLAALGLAGPALATDPPSPGLATPARSAAEYPPITFLPRLEVEQEKAELGKRIFFDPRLSGDEDRACAHCHRPKQGYSAALELSPGSRAGGGFRNIPSLINTAHKRHWGADGRHDQLSGMIAEMFTSPYTMGMDPLLMSERMNQDPDYPRLFAKAGYPNSDADYAYAAVEAYLKTLTSKNAGVDTGMLSEGARRGKALFEGKAGCIRCHHGAMLSDGGFHALGVPENREIETNPANLQALTAHARALGGSLDPSRPQDLGRYWVSGSPEEMATFATPSLRELSKTGPYMHNGVFDSLAEVVEFYYFGGGSSANRSPLLGPLDLDFQEINDLIAFLDALTGRDLSSERYVWRKGYPAEYPALRYWDHAASPEPKP
jgi:cytochrome c peroxidase